MRTTAIPIPSQEEGELVLGSGDFTCHVDLGTCVEVQDALRILMTFFEEISTAQSRTKEEPGTNRSYNWVVWRSRVNVIVSRVHCASIDTLIL